ncbi:conjugal transfer protein [Streptomyces lydicus]|uniref:conjugal transfer protein n=1 Tax=Streptomyces lydicus TaxID=47763 RepID=UPI0037A593A8
MVALAAISGVRSWVTFPPQAPAPKPAHDASADYPVQSAQAVAARWSRTYLSWDEQDAATRTRLLAADMPQGTDTASRIGWDGKGRQTVLAVQPGEVNPSHQHRARVHIEALVQPDQPPKKGKRAAPQTRPHWVALEVPVVSTKGRIVVTGQPGIVGMPTSGPDAPDHTAPATDATFSSQTQSVVNTFFGAYADHSADSVTAPGASVPPLPADLQLGEVRSWTADTGRGDDRTGTAVVTWDTGGAELEQTYRLKLTRVSSAAADRWQVAEVRGGDTA